MDEILKSIARTIFVRKAVALYAFVCLHAAGRKSILVAFRFANPRLFRQTDQSLRAYGLVQRRSILRCGSILASLTKSFDFDNLTLG